MVDRTKSGIPGLDELIEGGFPTGSSILVSGGAGSGKTIFCTQFIYNGAAQHNEPGLYVTLESNLKNIMWDMQSFNWDIKKYQDKNLIRIYKLNLTDVDESKQVTAQIKDELEIITNFVKEIKAKRLVIDSSTVLGSWFEGTGKLRKIIFSFTDYLKTLNCTTLLTAETKGAKTDFSAFGIEEFVVDGVVALYFFPPNRSMFIRKMRGTNHSKKIHPINISSNGIDIKWKDEISWEAIK